MKITKSYLKQIIKEELQYAQEGRYNPSPRDERKVSVKVYVHDKVGNIHPVKVDAFIDTYALTQEDAIEVLAVEMGGKVFDTRDLKQRAHFEKLINKKLEDF